MTVDDLISELLKLPENTQVCVEDDEGGGYAVLGLRLYQEPTGAREIAIRIAH